MTSLQSMKTKWDRIWEITQCEPGKSILLADEVTLELYEEGIALKAHVNAKNSSGSKSWASGFTMNAAGTQLTGMIDTEWFTITYLDPDPDVPGDKAKLECTRGAEARLVAHYTVASLPRARGTFGRVLAWVTTEVIGTILGIYNLMVDLLPEEVDTGGQPGTWSAEDGGNRHRMTITPIDYDAQPHVRRRRA